MKSREFRFDTFYETQTSLYNGECITPVGSPLMNVVDVKNAICWFEENIKNTQNQKSDTKNEYLEVLYLDEFDQVLFGLQFTNARKNQVEVKIKEIFRQALQVGAVQIMMLHNHPSGNITPGKSDLYLTERILRAANILGIMLKDHIIVGENTYFSFRGNGILN